MKTIERVITMYILRVVYILSCIIKVKKRIVFATYREDYLSGNYGYIIKELDNRQTGYEKKILFEPYGQGISGKIKYFFHMMKATYYMATSSYFIVDDFYFPVYTVNRLREGTEVIQVWHACGAFKKFALSTIEKSDGNNNYIKYVPIHSNYSKVIVTSSDVRKHYAEAFNIGEENILPIGAARTDIFFNKKLQIEIKEKIYSKYPYLMGKKVILYAPTFRGNGQSDADLDISIDLNEISKNLKEGYVFVLKMHPFVKNKIDVKDYSNIVDLSEYRNINDILIITDLLITDYSSTVFEYALLERPMIFYADDLDDYIDKRDFYYDYEEFVPGPIVKDTYELLKVIEKDNWDYKKILNFKNKFFDYTDGKASQRFVDKVILKKDN